MQTHYWGFDSSKSTLDLVEGLPLSDFVAKNYAKPSFVARYAVTVEGYSTGLSVAEVKACFARGEAIFPIYNRVDGANIQAGYASGWAMAQECINAIFALMDGLGIAPDARPVIVAWLDIEASFFPSADTMRGWMENMARAGLIGGFYLASNVAAHVSAYLAARADSKAPSLIWSSEWEPTADHSTVILDFLPDLALLGARAGEVALWQYSEGDTIDMNVATEAAMQHAWNPAPVAKTARSRHTVPLRPVPVLQSTLSLHTVLGGDIVILTKQTTPHWQQVTCATKKGTITGWLDKNDLEPVAA